MPLPLLLGIGAAIAGAAGIGAAINGCSRLRAAEEARRRHEANLNRTIDRSRNRINEQSRVALDIIHSFPEFADAIEIIQNRPDFNAIELNDAVIPAYAPEELRRVAIEVENIHDLADAGIRSADGIAVARSGAMTAAADGIAATGAGALTAATTHGIITTAVTTLGTASTGTPIASLSGAAATSATLANLGGGAIAAGGGGIALGTIVLGTMSLGAGLLSAGILLNRSANNREEELHDDEIQTNRNCGAFEELNQRMIAYQARIRAVRCRYRQHLNRIRGIVFDEMRTGWNEFSDDERLDVERCTYLISFLYHMCVVVGLLYNLLQSIIELAQNNRDINEVIRDIILELNRIINLADALLNR